MIPVFPCLESEFSSVFYKKSFSCGFFEHPTAPTVGKEKVCCLGQNPPTENSGFAMNGTSKNAQLFDL